jgi:hypothetical protein
VDIDTIGMRRQSRAEASVNGPIRSSDYTPGKEPWADPAASTTFELNLIDPLTPLYGLSPAIALTLILGVFHGSLFFLLGAHRGRHLLFYLALASGAALLAQLLAPAWNLPAPLVIGECNVLAITSACWLTFLISRAARA